MTTGTVPVPEIVKQRQSQIEQIKHFTTRLRSELDGIQELLSISTMPLNELLALWATQRSILSGIKSLEGEYHHLIGKPTSKSLKLESSEDQKYGKLLKFK